MTTRIIILIAFLGTLAAPLIMRPQTRYQRSQHTLVILSPHTEEIRHEFSLAFDDWHQQKFGESVECVWRNIGGTSEIARYIRSEFGAAFENYWQANHGQAIPLSDWLRPDRLAPEKRESARQIREELLNELNGISIGVDLFYGGGEYDHDRCRRYGYTVPCPVSEEILEGIPQQVAGIDFYHKQGYWYGTALSSFGIVFNRHLHAMKSVDLPIPQGWADLANPRYRSLLALADPRNSGAATKGFEMILQSEMVKTTDRETGWRNGWGLIRRLAANARYFANSSSKIPNDVAARNAAAGMAIDFYGRFQAQYIDGDEVGYINPIGGTVVSPDPISLMRGAPNRAVATRFVEFCLSEDGQKLWDLPVGFPGGPKQFVTRRSSIRPAIYEQFEDHLLNRDNPFTRAETGLRYRAEWTAPMFNLLRHLIGAMCIDTHHELKAAWDAVNARPDQKQRLEAFDALPITHAEALELTAEYASSLETMERRHKWLMFFKNQYQRTIHPLGENSGI